MKVDLPAGKYVLAVSGGVDSAVLLDVLSKMSNVELIVAHFDHGIREDSYKDADFVRSLANKYGLTYIHAEGNLGATASEEKARDARYNFLKKIQTSHNAHGIITAHHQDDVIETAIINVIRGTKRKGLTSLDTSPEILRPLLAYSKKQIKEYARANKIEWREDVTNTDERYLRNYIRRIVAERLSPSQRKKLLESIGDMREINQQIDELLALFSAQGTLDRSVFAGLDHQAAKEVLAHLLRENNVSFDRVRLEKLSTELKVARVGSTHDISGGWRCMIEPKVIRLYRVK